MKASFGEKFAAPSAKLKWKKDEAKRIAILENELEVIRFHYVDRDGFLCYQDKGLECPYCRQGEFRYKFGLNVLVYDLVPSSDGSGQQVPNGKFSVKIWTFGSSTYEDLQRLKASWGDLTARDLYVTCDNEQFQNVKVDPLPESLWLGGYFGAKEQVLQNYNATKKDVGTFLLSQVTLPGQAPKARRGQAPAAAPSAPFMPPAGQPLPPMPAAGMPMSPSVQAPMTPPPVQPAQPAAPAPLPPLTPPGGQGNNLEKLMGDL